MCYKEDNFNKQYRAIIWKLIPGFKKTKSSGNVHWKSVLGVARIISKKKNLSVQKSLLFAHKRLERLTKNIETMMLDPEILSCLGVEFSKDSVGILRPFKEAIDRGYSTEAIEYAVETSDRLVMCPEHGKLWSIKWLFRVLR